METPAWLTLAVALVACGAPALPVAVDPPPREPPGAFLDPLPAEPSPSPVGDARGVIALTLPLSRVAARALVLSYVRGFTTGDGSIFASLVARTAKRIDDEGGSDLLPALAQRLRAIDYSHLVVDQVVSYDNVQMTECVGSPSPCPAGTQQGDIVLDIPIRIQEVGVVKLFGSKIQMVVRRFPAPSGWLIVSVREPGAPWVS